MKDDTFGDATGTGRNEREAREDSAEDGCDELGAPEDEYGPDSIRIMLEAMVKFVEARMQALGKKAQYSRDTIFDIDSSDTESLALIGRFSIGEVLGEEPYPGTPYTELLAKAEQAMEKIAA